MSAKSKAFWKAVLSDVVYNKAMDAYHKSNNKFISGLWAKVAGAASAYKSMKAYEKLWWKASTVYKASRKLRGK